MKYREIRRTSNTLNDEQKINDLLMRAKIGYLGLSDEEGTYVVPLNYVWKDQMIFFHSSDEGRKTDALKTSSRVCFTVSEDLGTVAHPLPSDIGTSYTSVMVFGQIKMIEDIGEATRALQGMLDKFVPGYFEKSLAPRFVEQYRSSLNSKTVVYCLVPDQITGKQALAEPNEIFFVGRKQADDLKKNR
ncbi:pyridoxamine 5'-phosphate oxidase family protein [Bacillus sp. DNRA2]|uniref:pyridoxamine 5'-phosphate oxidase family protein n=1 Tax=Bacillus sp. DNRA2 TaxID=2723053 RepID=UPI00145ECBC0|nr:pyridoxamine 5'-phosphate oxidase family protein [Bacillus sp. DNRA2]NMD71721.1 pyridoxamine 5'-phosphate oxidase family protein [Bacillus sp. DNRA2]